MNTLDICFKLIIFKEVCMDVSKIKKLYASRKCKIFILNMILNFILFYFCIIVFIIYVVSESNSKLVNVSQHLHNSSFPFLVKNIYVFIFDHASLLQDFELLTNK